MAQVAVFHSYRLAVSNVIVGPVGISWSYINAYRCRTRFYSYAVDVAVVDAERQFRKCLDHARLDGHGSGIYRKLTVQIVQNGYSDALRIFAGWEISRETLACLGNVCRRECICQDRLFSFERLYFTGCQVDCCRAGNGSPVARTDTYPVDFNPYAHIVIRAEDNTSEKIFKRQGPGTWCAYKRQGRNVLVLRQGIICIRGGSHSTQKNFGGISVIRACHIGRSRVY